MTDVKDITPISSLPVSAEKSVKKRPKGQHKKKFITMQKRVWSKGATYKSLPDLLCDNPIIDYSTMAVYWVLFKTNPGRINHDEISKKIRMAKRKVNAHFNILVNRKIIRMTQGKSGSCGPLYEIEMDPEKWDLTTPDEKLENFLVPMRNQKKNFQFPCGTRKVDFQFPCGTGNRISGSYAEPERPPYYDSNSYKDQNTYRNITNEENESAPLGGPFVSSKENKPSEEQISAILRPFIEESCQAS